MFRLLLFLRLLFVGVVIVCVVGIVFVVCVGVGSGGVKRSMEKMGMLLLVLLGFVRWFLLGG